MPRLVQGSGQSSGAERRLFGRFADREWDSASDTDSDVDPEQQPLRLPAKRRRRCTPLVRVTLVGALAEATIGTTCLVTRETMNMDGVPGIGMLVASLLGWGFAGVLVARAWHVSLEW